MPKVSRLTEASASRGGPRYNTLVDTADSGAEVRDQKWSYPRHEYDAACAIQTIEWLEDLLYFFHVAGGKTNGFRFKDWMDFKSCRRLATPSPFDVAIGTGDGVTASFQLLKKYIVGSYLRSRKILKPVAGPLLIGVAGLAKIEGTHFAANYTNGLITFTGGNIPASDQAVTWGGEFDVPVRFDVNALSVQIEDYIRGNTQVPLIELKYGDV